MQTRFDLTQTDIPKSWYNLQADFPVVDQQALPFLHHRKQLGVGQFDAGLVAGRRIAVEGEVSRVPDNRLPVLKRAHAQLWPLEVGKNGDRPTGNLLEIPDGPDRRRVVLVRAVAHVHAEGIGACAPQLG